MADDMFFARMFSAFGMGDVDFGEQYSQYFHRLNYSGDGHVVYWRGDVSHPDSPNPVMCEVSGYTDYKTSIIAYITNGPTATLPSQLEDIDKWFQEMYANMESAFPTPKWLSARFYCPQGGPGWVSTVERFDLTPYPWLSNKKLKIPGVEELELNATLAEFFDKNLIVDLIFEEGITRIEGNGTTSSAFSNLYNLTNLHLPDTLTHIRNDAFRYSLALRDVFIPKSVIGYPVSTWTRSWFGRHSTGTFPAIPEKFPAYNFNVAPGGGGRKNLVMEPGAVGRDIGLYWNSWMELAGYQATHNVVGNRTREQYEAGRFKWDYLNGTMIQDSIF